MAKKRLGWLSDILNNPRPESETIDKTNDSQEPDLLAIEKDPVEQEEIAIPEQVIEEEVEEFAAEEDYTSREVLSIKEDEDKITFDLVVAVKNIVNDRQLTVNRLANIEVQLSDAIEKNIKLKSDFNKKEKELQEAHDFIRSLEEKITTKQMTYDQLLEDYKTYQENAKAEIDNVKFLFQKEQEKYVKLTLEAKINQNEANQKIDNLEERIRDLEAENKKITEQYQMSLADKNQLLQTINEFTNRFTGKTTSMSSYSDRFKGDSEPPRIKVD